MPAAFENESGSATRGEWLLECAYSLWLFSFRAKYDVVGRLATAAEAEAAALADERREAYLDALEAMSTGDHTTESVGEVRHTRQ